MISQSAKNSNWVKVKIIKHVWWPYVLLGECFKHCVLF